MDSWLATRPLKVQEVARRFPLGVQLKIDNQQLFLLGYGEEKNGEIGLIMSCVNPYDNYEEAVKEENRVRICSSHLCKHEDGP